MARTTETSYLLRDIDAKLWEQFKQKADASGMPIRSLLLRLVAACADGSLSLEQSLTMRAEAPAAAAPTPKATTRRRK